MGKIKANTYASFIHENSRAGIGGIIRDASGNLITTLSVPTQCKTNNQAEAMAALYVTSWCKQGGYNKYDLEFDSMIVANMIKDKDTKNLKLKGIIETLTRP
ncbi:hypothetical protein AABB24_000541 [Solanum stoloniferum]|uniref:RNase H type-1 domain-containing protein n=2 Tax=Solanum TaxID=4107 RepID=A0AAF0PP34_SOLVR|nr:hypothetical protein MTR67_001963 [Solanum verrucosum]